MSNVLSRKAERKIATGVIGLSIMAMLCLLIYYWQDFVQYCFSVQITLHRYLVLYLLQQNSQQLSGGLMLIIGSFIYGLLHAIGPGHGKFVITTFLATHREKLQASRLITLSGSLMQGVVAVVFVVVLAIMFNFSTGDLSRSRYWIEKVNALLIAAFGVVLICRALGIKLRLFKRGRQAACGCGHHHYPAEHALSTGWRNAIWLTLTIGIRPCSGALMILVFSNAIGMFSWGVAAVMAMSLGTALSIIVLASLVHYAREWMIAANSRWVSQSAASAAQLALLVGGVVLIVFALVLFNTVIPVSANGDFITAGC